MPGYFVCSNTSLPVTQLLKPVIRLWLCLALPGLLCLPARADEGMWLPYAMSPQIVAQMKQKGLAIPFDSIYSEQHASLKDAIVSLNDGNCTGSFISHKGLLLTNHHCGFDQIQQHSTLEHDYLTNGFWAQNTEAELPCAGLTASILVATHQVTQRVTTELGPLLFTSAREDKMDSLSAILSAELIHDANCSGQLVAFFENNLFLFMVTKTFRDVRLVGAPPSAIGKFGGDTDNWEWPRHTGDFCYFRVYADAQNQPADYHPQNLPYHPIRHLRIADSAIDRGDFSLIMGYPGTTRRFLTSDGIRQLQEKVNPTIAEVRGIKQSIWKTAMQLSEKVNIQYASKYSTSSNYWKYALGQNEGLRKSNLIDQRVAIEERLAQWAAEDTARKTLANSISALQAAYLISGPLVNVQTLYEETMLTSPDLMGVALEMSSLSFSLKDTDDDSLQKKLVEQMKQTLDDFYRDFDPDTDRKVMQAMLHYLYTHVADDFLPDTQLFVPRKYRENWDEYIQYLYSQSLFASKEKSEYFFLKRKAPEKELLNDPMMKLLQTMLTYYFDLESVLTHFNHQISLNNHTLVKGILSMSSHPLYPDANSTQRLSYGTIEPYQPYDGASYHWQTYLKGVVEKARLHPLDHDFALPDSLQQLLTSHPTWGNQPTCFITNNDITGGNSGSPVLNGKGKLIGLAFDGNWEALTSDLAYNAQLQRTICVDIRYILFVTRHWGKAEWLLGEMEDLDQADHKNNHSWLPNDYFYTNQTAAL